MRDARERRPVPGRGGKRAADVGGNADDARPRTILDEAAALTSRDRNKVYGHPRLHFACTAAMIQAYLIRRGWTPPPGGLLAADWSQMIILDKTARQAGNLSATGALHRDSSIDQAGYARTGEMLGEP